MFCSVLISAVDSLVKISPEVSGIVTAFRRGDAPNETERPPRRTNGASLPSLTRAGGSGPGSNPAGNPGDIWATDTETVVHDFRALCRRL